MQLRHRSTGEVIPRERLPILLPNVSLPDVLAPDTIHNLGFDVVEEGVQPTPANHYQTVERSGVEEINGQWFTKYILVERDAEAKAAMDAAEAERVRADRNQRLSSCDWTQLPDAVADHAAWALYRKQLRDISGQAGFPWAVTWPELPHS